ncbi:potassium transporter Kup [Limnohabitans sp. Jir61]|uniref:potassium transporter Kup n=1 Tax=Limnohabitans sp. Jir61 TaxID=1826168 RepID=UPI000D357273|nr:potassium transporter Kup [Limnohabitans sp. Jir61]PUE29569.1 potassium transporter Kup [Limnohabitans sp. Jir61]
MSAIDSDNPSAHIKRQSTAALTLGAIGVVYGDIGTSPLYTVKEVFLPATGVALTPENLIGAVSAIFWALMLIVTLKYVILILRADNRGEGGALALTALAANAVKHKPRLRHFLLLLGLFGATLFYGDSVITPAISVLGAVEGLEIATPLLQPYVVPIALAVLVLLFFMQRWGTNFVGKFFGPIIVVWFLILGYTGIEQIVQTPEILAALNPLHGINFLMDRGPFVLAAVGAIVLALTGAEALYADMGHFGRKPIQIAWMGLVMPSLALHYMGQGALLMHDATAIENPFFRMFSEDWLIPAVLLATVAAIIASQAVISGAYSMTKQAILLGFLPRMDIKYTSEQEVGQIYMPGVNWILLAGVVLAVLAFRSSSALAGAYGIAVTLTMVITTIMTFFVVHDAWKMPTPLAIGATLFFLAIDSFLFAGCIIKFFDGGWLPLAMGLTLYLVMTTWSRGRELVVDTIRRDGLDLNTFIQHIDSGHTHLAKRTAIYAVANPETVPQALLHNMKHNQVLHEKNVILTVEFDNVPWVSDKQRVRVERLSEHFWQVWVKFGFMNTPDVPKALKHCEPLGLEIPVFETSYFLSRETVISTPGGGMAQWREKLFSAMTRNSGGVVEFFNLPDNSVVELGTRVQI